MGFIVKLIFKTLSIRGIGKIGSTNNSFIKYIWMSFIFMMTFLLLYSTGKLIQEFFKYDLVIRLSINANDYSTEFPTFSFCHQYPFGPNSKTHWDNRSIMSPTEFNKRIRDAMRDAMPDKKEFVQALFYFDDRRNYYQHLRVNESDKLGWSIEDTFVICYKQFVKSSTVGKGVDCQLHVTKVSLPEYFNCFSVTPVDDDPKERVNSLALLIRISSGINESLEHNKGFLNGIFDQLSGIRGMLHVKDTYPDIKNQGFNFEPGKVVEVSYETVKKNKISTPKRPCTNKPRELLRDLNEHFSFTQEDCYQALVGQETLKNCGCYYSDSLRDGLPNSTHEYCGHFLGRSFDKLKNRIGCLQQVIFRLESQKTEIFNKECMASCMEYDYRVSLSVSRWVPTNWQVGWMLDTSEATRSYISNDNPTDNKKWYDKIMSYVDSKDLLLYPQVTRFIDQDNFVMVVLRRRGFETIEQREKLTLDLYNLVSRFGGLCSLCLGLTCAFIMEIVEIIYLTIQHHRKIIQTNNDQGQIDNKNLIDNNNLANNPDNKVDNININNSDELTDKTNSNCFNKEVFQADESDVLNRVYEEDKCNVTSNKYVSQVWLSSL